MSDNKEAALQEAPLLALAAHEVRMIDMDLLEPDPKQPRDDAQEPQALGVLKTSFKCVNIIHPITVRPHPTKPGRFMIVVGERRWCAAAGLGARKMPAIVRENLTDVDAFQLQVAENFKGGSVGWSGTQLANAVERLMNDMKMDQIAVAGYLGMSQPWVVQVLALKNLDPQIAAFRDAHPEITRDKTALINLDKLHRLDSAAANKVMEQAVAGKKLARLDVSNVLKVTKQEKAPPGKQSEKSKPKGTSQLDGMLGPDEAHAGDVAFKADFASNALNGAAGAGSTEIGAPDAPSSVITQVIRPERVSQKKVRQVVALLGLPQTPSMEELLDRLMDEYVQTKAATVDVVGAAQSQRPAAQLAANQH
ncbi:ParB/RepB/Spo0J family partition protein [Duganella vulcania]|uniref:ParB/RepB/Spo0J family partition protein n=1 Tax=Duganella vulcania TaxID=2692166 RepID=A0A845GH49_9BURK|nr:ParB/RepB/Spo0J family partition protein [Duganella vulcania]MYM92752.1 ParB/RepB/Spo0J family partition protein [Duganella vulcania]